MLQIKVMVGVAQLAEHRVVAPGGRGFKSRRSPQQIKLVSTQGAYRG